jgi:2-dehydropantoate 2-reductase
LGRAVVVSVQNGISQRLLAGHVSPKRLVVGMTATNMAICEPGVVSLQRNGITVIGAGTEETPPAVVEQAEAVLAKSRLPVRSERNILGVQYNKLLMNTIGYASVLSDSDFITEGILDRGWRRAVAMPVLAEGLRVLDTAGIGLVRTPGLSDVLRFRRLLATIDAPPVGAVLRFVLTRLTAPKRIVYSLYQDLARGRKTEIDFVNGEIVRLAATHGTEAPRNATVVQMVRELERREPGRFFSREDVVSRFEKIARRENL